MFQIIGTLLGLFMAREREEEVSHWETIYHHGKKLLLNREEQRILYRGREYAYSIDEDGEVDSWLVDE